MEDLMMIRRYERFRTRITNNDLIEEGQNRLLSIRKDRLEKYLLMRRNINEKEHPDYEVDLHNLNLPTEVIQQAEELIVYLSNPNIIQGLFCNDVNIIKFSLYLLRRHYENDKSEQVDNSNNNEFLDRLCEFLNFSDKVIQYESSWILINLTCYYPLAIKRIMNKSCFVKLIDFFENSSDIVLIMHGLNILSNIVEGSKSNRKTILFSNKLNLINKLDKYLSCEVAGKKFVKICLDLIYNLLKVKPYADNDFSKFEVFIDKIRSIYINNICDDLDHTCVYIMRIFAKADEHRYLMSFLHSNVTKKILNHCYSEIPQIKSISLKVLAEFLSGNDIITELLINEGLLDVYRQILEEKNEENMKQVLFGISNIASGNNKHLKQAYDSKLIDKVLEIISIYITKEKNCPIQDDIIIECFYCLCCSLAKNNLEVSLSIVKNDHVEIIKLLIEGINLFLGYNDKLLELLLISLSNLLRLEDENLFNTNFKQDIIKYGLTDKLDILSKNKNKNIQDRVNLLIEEMDLYNIDEENDNIMMII